ncbi:MAG: CoA ester lyase [Rhizobiales bacterium]|nr:CoA ester lyase [Hyphomicrobiales bacterium]
MGRGDGIVSIEQAPGLLAPLFVPADRPERFAKAAASGADAVLIDIEDAVAPAGKAAARDGLAGLRPTAVPVIVRVNAPGTPWHDDDVALVAARPGLGLMLPKAEDPALVAALVARLGPGRAVVPLLETALGVYRAVEIARVPGVAQLAFGPADFCNDVASDDSPEALLLARSTLVLASRLGGLPAPLDGPCFDFRDGARTTSEARHARSLGFGGKLAIHPAQVAWIGEAFAPTAAELAWARGVLAAGGEGGASGVAGMMVDAPILARARRVLSRAR